MVDHGLGLVFSPTSLLHIILCCTVLPIEMPVISKTNQGNMGLTMFKDDTPKILLLLGKVVSRTPPNNVIEYIPLSLVFNSNGDDGEFHQVQVKLDHMDDHDRNYLYRLYRQGLTPSGASMPVWTIHQLDWDKFNTDYRRFLDEVADHSKIKKGSVEFLWQYEGEGPAKWHSVYPNSRRLDNTKKKSVDNRLSYRTLPIYYDDNADGPIDLSRNCLYIHQHLLLVPSEPREVELQEGMEELRDILNSIPSGKRVVVMLDDHGNPDGVTVAAVYAGDNEGDNANADGDGGHTPDGGRGRFDGRFDGPLFEGDVEFDFYAPIA